MVKDCIGDAEIGLIGIGSMGFPMAETLLRAGFSVTVYDRSEDTLEAFVDRGGRRADSSANVAERCQIVHVVVETDEQADDVVLGEDGVFSGFEDGDDDSILVIHSTVLPDTVMAFDAVAPHSVSVLDAAVSGAPERAANGDLALMIGGDPETIAFAAPVLDALSREYYHLGPVGAGLAAKFANNVVLYASAAGTLEAVDLGTAYGIDQDDLLEVIADSTGDCYYVRNFEYLSRELWADHPSGPFAGARLSKKTLSQALELSADLDVEVPVTGLLSQRIPELYKEIAAKIESQD